MGNIVKFLSENHYYVLSSDSAILLSFLGRPRTLDEVARHLGISKSKAERLVIKAVESGQVFVSSKRRNRVTSIAGTTTVSGSSLESKSLKYSEGMSGRGFRRVDNSRVPARIEIRRGDLFFKFRRDKASTVRKVAVPPQVSEILGMQKIVARKKDRVSLSEEVRLLEALDPGPRSLDELRASLGVSRDTVERFVRNGLLRCDWGPKGIGNFYKITRLGLAELRRLRTASTLDSSIVRRGLISLKRAIPQLAG